jgi:hypothetical protein
MMIRFRKGFRPWTDGQRAALHLPNYACNLFDEMAAWEIYSNFGILFGGS